MNARHPVAAHRAASADDLAGVWRALADPTRREILDRLRGGPQTTGDLVEHCALSRFGVMKHLGVLVEAGLVLVRREGRQRWNHLNPMPIHQIARRWIRPFEAAAAEQLLRLKFHAERPTEDIMAKATEFRALDIQLEVEIAASRDKVWRSLTTEIGEWWPKQFYVGTSPKRFRLEGRVGGQVVEDWGNGEGSLFGTITVFEEQATLQWAGDMSADFGGPARSVTTFRLTAGPRAGTTLISFRDTPFGLLGEAALAGLQQGWTWLLHDILKPYIEQGRRPERPATLEG
ncbi:MAG: metalloregulator ArsR/SmtB family transcription factor [Gemmatimonadetes bacterium]|nr:metalloregulator ArsR/SmtB family transcription factor [Gemmatimonadota bacterium]MBK6779618.1 metalloregulator ArsR/SmtB family transcription factor [Gemmatimonadota bacterium]MBK7350342.1 metalloregulator ArsR/SmtB family transcription factor [Gemmatimonadota bacterium]MBK7716404.1 metalloregulator ArsR/SmtB family transcription factor [Gemmatimonadota bacterium]MBK7785485.1 metalloregulator ArsR/SmtB family transcription factor [Gemmatimonadota bacterium]